MMDTPDLKQRIWIVAIFACFIFWGIYLLPYATKEEKDKQKEFCVLLLNPYQSEKSLLLQEALSQKLKQHSIFVESYNAKGHLGSFQSKVESLNPKKWDLIVSFSTWGTRMLLQKQENAFVYYINANLKKEEKKNRHLIGGLEDQVPADMQAEFIKQAFSKVNKLTFICEGERFPKEDRDLFLKTAKNLNLQTQQLIIYRLSELYTIERALDVDTQALFIFRDELVLEGLERLIERAEKLGIPLIACDELSVRKGAAIALAIEEQNLVNQAFIHIVDYLQKKQRPLENQNPWWQEHALVWVHERALLNGNLKIEDLYQAASHFGKEIKKVS